MANPTPISYVNLADCFASQRWGRFWLVHPKKGTKDAKDGRGGQAESVEEFSSLLKD
jgi:hypothetical protein